MTTSQGDRALNALYAGLTPLERARLLARLHRILCTKSKPASESHDSTRLPG